MARRPSWICENNGHTSDLGIKLRISRPNFFEIGLWLRYGDINIFKREAIRHLEFLKFAILFTVPVSASL